jgi:hypothetical protein
VCHLGELIHGPFEALLGRIHAAEIWTSNRYSHQDLASVREPRGVTPRLERVRATLVGRTP